MQPLFTADGRTLGVVGYANVNIGLADYKIMHKFYVVEKLNHSVLFGIDFLHIRSIYITIMCRLTVLPLQTFDKLMVLFKKITGTCLSIALNRSVACCIFD